MKNKVHKSRFKTDSSIKTKEDLLNNKITNELVNRIKNLTEPVRSALNSVTTTSAADTPFIFTNNSEKRIPEWQVDEIVDRTSKQIVKLKKSNKAVIELILDEKGSLYRKGSNDFYYKVASKQRLMLLRLLTDEYSSTDEVYKKIHCKSREALYKLRSDMNRVIRHKCNIKDDLIDLQRITGIRINPNYKIVLPDS